MRKHAQGKAEGNPREIGAAISYEIPGCQNELPKKF